MGFSVMQTFMDDLEVVSHPGEGTLVRMRKKIAAGVRARPLPSQRIPLPRRNAAMRKRRRIIFPWSRCSAAALRRSTESGKSCINRAAWGS